MTASSGISLLAQSIAQSKRLTNLGGTLDDLQRQITTKKKYDTYAGFGTTAYKLQTVRLKTTKIETYIDNTTEVGKNMEQTTSIMSQISNMGNKFKSALILRENNAQSTQSLALTAKDYLEFIQDLLNQVGNDGTYLLAGTNTSDAPFIDGVGLNRNFSDEVDNWFNGVTTTDQLMADVTGFGTAELGLDPDLDTATHRTASVSDTTNIEYTLTANSSGIKDLIKSLTLVANMRYTDATAVPTQEEMVRIFDYAADLTVGAIRDINTETSKLAAKYSLVQTVATRHKDDLALFKSQIDDIENADTAEALIKMNLLETQISAAYKITSTVSGLSLVDYI